MNLSLRPPGGDRTWWALLLLAAGGWMAATASSRFALALGILFLVSGAGLWLRRSWGPWTALIGFILIDALLIRKMSVKGFSWATTLGIICTVWFVWQVFRDQFK